MVSGPVWLMQPIPYFGEKIHGAWVYEPKIDGWRMQIVRYNNGKLECWGRRLERKPNWSEKLRYLVRDLQDVLPAGTILDCELYSSRGRRFIPSLFARHPKVKPIVFVFDIIYLRDMDISKKPLRKRKSLLAGICFKPPFYAVPSRKLTNIKRNYLSEVKKGHEGIIIKKLDLKYLIGKESPIATQDWRKIK
jgi:ATP-dependent DNA ligase